MTAFSALASSPISQMQARVYRARDKVLPALVHIQPVIKNYATGELEKQAVVGSGIIFHKDGYIVTNYHVAGNAVRILCTLSDKEVVSAEYVGGDPLTDLAILKIDPTHLSGAIRPVDFGNSDSIEVGQYVLALGSPLALSRSVSFGVISTPDRYFSPDVRLPTGERTGRYNLWIQTDAAINPGNSGGPLVDLDGHIIGINSRATMFANNLGFAIPINTVKEVTSAILSEGKVTRSWIGVHCQPLREMEDFFKTKRDAGVLVASIDPGSPAEESFLKAGDIILEIDNQAVSARFVEELPAFYALIARHSPGAEVQLKVLRNEQLYDFSITTRELGDLQGEDFECPEWAFTVKAITGQMQIENQLDDSLGVFVVGVKRTGPADHGGLIPGDVIKKVNKTTVNTLGEFSLLYDELVADGVEGLLLTTWRRGMTRFVFLDIEPKGDEVAVD